MFLKENSIDNYEELEQKSDFVSAEFAELSDKIKAIDLRLKEIAELQKYIGQYGKTRDIFQKYKASGWDNNFYEEHRADITLHRAAKKYFDALDMSQFPKMAELKQEYAKLLSEKKKLYSGYHELKEKRKDLLTAKSNCATILGIKNDASERDNSERKTR